MNNNYIVKSGKYLLFLFSALKKWHDHYDHMGGLIEILNSIPTDAVYIKPYYSHDEDGSGSETIRKLYANLLKKYFTSSFSCDEDCIKNPDTYRNSLKTIDNLYGTERNNIGKLEMSSTLYEINAKYEGKILNLGDMIIKIYNTTNLSYHSECYGTDSVKFDENANSIISYIQMGNRTALIAGDLEPVSQSCYNKIYGNCTSTKCSIMTNITEKINGGNKLNVDLLKLSHHGYSSCDMSTAIRDFLNPQKIIIPNWYEKIEYYYSSKGPYPNNSSCKNKYFNTQYFDSNSYYVGSNNVVFDFTDNDFNIYNN